MADQYAYKASTDLNITQGLTDDDMNLATSAVSQVAGAAIGAWSAHQLDKVRYTMEHDTYKYNRAAEQESRLQASFFSALNRDKLKETQMTARLGLKIDAMKQAATVQTQAAAANIENVPKIVRDINRTTLRAETYQASDQEQQLQQLNTTSIDNTRSRSVLYDGTKASAAAPITGALTDTLSVGKTAYGEYTGQEVFLDSRRGKVNSQLM